jgi:hypothetical protein
MPARWPSGPAFCLAATLAATPAGANRLTIEVWPDASPDHAVFCSVALKDGWISLVRVTGAGLPGPSPLRWRASPTEIKALSDSLQAFVGGTLHSVDSYAARQPPAPFLSVTWMTQLDGDPARGLYLQPGLTLPRSLSRTLADLDLARPCGLTATAAE